MSLSLTPPGLPLTRVLSPHTRSLSLSVCLSHSAIGLGARDAIGSQASGGSSCAGGNVEAGVGVVGVADAGADVGAGDAFDARRSSCQHGAARAAQGACVGVHGAGGDMGGRQTGGVRLPWAHTAQHHLLNDSYHRRAKERRLLLSRATLTLRSAIYSMDAPCHARLPVRLHHCVSLLTAAILCSIRAAH